MDKYATPVSVCITLVLLCALGPSALAQDSAAPAPPNPPYIAPLINDFSITKKFNYLAAGTLTAEEKATQSDPTNPVEVDMVKKGTIRKDTEHFLDGSGREIWRVQAYRFIVDLKHPDSVNLDLVGDPKDTLNIRYRDPGDFPELSWITDTTYTGVQNQQGKPCYVHKLGDQIAFIDASTRLPVSFQSKTVQVAYIYANPPDEPLQLPPGYAEKLAKFKRALRGQF